MGERQLRFKPGILYLGERLVHLIRQPGPCIMRVSVSVILITTLLEGLAEEAQISMSL